MDKAVNTNSWNEIDYSKITIQNDFMFGTVMQDPALCKKFLEVILNIRIAKIEYPEGQKTIDLAAAAHGIRLDIYVEDEEKTVYDAEMQTVTNKNLPKRSRYYQGMIDLNILNKGIDYRFLKRSIILFICPFDPFGKGEYLYRFENRCKLSDGDCLELNDGSEKIFVNAAGTRGDVTDDFRNLMKFILENTASDSFTSNLRDSVIATRNNTKWRRDYMKLEVLLSEKRNEGRAEGLAEGREEGLAEGRRALIEFLCEISVPKDTAVQKLMEKFSLSREEAIAETDKYWR